MKMELLSELTVRARAGNREAAKQLLIKAHTPVSFLCGKLLHNPEAAETMTRTILKQLPHQLEALEDPADFEDWVCRITASRCAQYLSRNGDSPKDPTVAQPEKVKIPAKRLDESQTAQVIQQMTDDLPEEPRIFLLLYCCGSLSTGAIARLFGITEKAVVDQLEVAQGLVNTQLRKFHRMGIRFAPVTSLPELLRSAMFRSADPAAAGSMVRSILAQKTPAAPLPSAPPHHSANRNLIRAVVVTAVLLVLMLGAIFLLELGR